MKRIIHAMKYMGGAIAATAVGILSWLIFSIGVSAASTSMVISQLQLGASGASKQEYVQLHNNTDTDVDITDWCLTYSDYKDETRTTLVCFQKPAGVDQLRVPPYGNVLVASQTYTLPEGIATGERFAGSSTDLSGVRGHIRLSKPDGTEVDKVAWDNKASTPPLSPETFAALAPAAGKSIARSGDKVLIDTDNNFADFHEQVSSLVSSDLYEYVAPKPVVDLCQLDGIQEILPEGYGYDEAGNCELLSSDLCQNIEKIQTEYPAGMLSDEVGNCMTDSCINLDGLQQAVPEGYLQVSGTCTKLEDRPLLITELLANASGTDAGQEFIEVYNPNDSFVSLDGYKFQIGKTFEKTFPLVTPGSLAGIGPHEYATFSDDELGFTLLNTASGVRLVTPAGTSVSETSYSNPKDDMSWAAFLEGWQYTNVPTPKAENQPSVVESDEEVLSSAVTLAPCGPGKYRHPITNRCRNIEADASALASCDADEYRNPETNRCRKLASLASVTLASCDEGYERNAETNRCRKVAGVATTLKACEPGYERSAETNRCRAIAPASQKATTFAAPQQTKSSLNLPAIGVVSTVAIGYALYEWRREFSKGLKAAATILKR